MFTATIAYLFLWTGGTALVLLGAGRRNRPSLGVAVGFGWGIGILGAGPFEVVGALEQWPVRLLGDVYLAHGDCRSGAAIEVTRPTQQPR